MRNDWPPNAPGAPLFATTAWSYPFGSEGMLPGTALFQLGGATGCPLTDPVWKAVASKSVATVSAAATPHTSEAQLTNVASKTTIAARGAGRVTLREWRTATPSLGERDAAGPESRAHPNLNSISRRLSIVDRRLAPGSARSSNPQRRRRLRLCATCAQGRGLRSSVRTVKGKPRSERRSDGEPPIPLWKVQVQTHIGQRPVPERAAVELPGAPRRGAEPIREHYHARLRGVVAFGRCSFRLNGSSDPGHLAVHCAG